jgi:hypothetical protein
MGILREIFTPSIPLLMTFLPDDMLGIIEDIPEQMENHVFIHPTEVMHGALMIPTQRELWTAYVIMLRMNGDYHIL